MNILYIFGTLIITAVIAVISTLAYLEDKPRIKATGEHSSWNAPPGISFNGIGSYIRLDIRNVGDAEAKEIKLRTPFRGKYIINNEGDLQQFDNDVQLEDLNPSEGYIVEIWSESSRASIYPGEVNITHTRGASDVDFGYQANGVTGMIFKIIAQWWILGIIPLFLILLLGIDNYELRKKLRQS